MYLQNWAACYSSILSSISKCGNSKGLCVCEVTPVGEAHGQIKKSWREINAFHFLKLQPLSAATAGGQPLTRCHCSIIACCWKVRAQPSERATYPVILRTVCSYQFAWVEWPQRVLLQLRCGDGSELCVGFKNLQTSPCVFLCGRWHKDISTAPSAILILALAFKHIVHHHLFLV